MTDIKFENVTKSFGGLTVLDELNMTVDGGEFLVLLGPSGCGKSTLLGILAGLIEQTSGRVVIGGRDVTDLDPKDRNLAMVFQSYALYPTKTVRGNLRFGLISRGYSREEIDRRIASVSKLLQIEQLLDRKPSQLSGGQRQRVAIGRALVKQVEVCLFDEPLSNLDAKLRTEMRLEIKNLHDQFRNTIVYVTHDQVEAMTMATRIAVMNRGVVEQIGTPDEIYNNPQTVFVAEFVGSPSMNFIDLAITGDGPKVVGSSAQHDLQFELEMALPRSTPTKPMTALVGIRPENVEVHSVGAATLPNSYPATIRYFEKIGPEVIYFFDLAGRRVAARMASSKLEQLQVGDQVMLSFPSRHMLVFEKQSGKRVVGQTVRQSPALKSVS